MPLQEMPLPPTPTMIKNLSTSEQLRMEPLYHQDESYYSPYDWPLQTKAQPFSNQEQYVPPKTASVIKPMVSTDSLGDLRELWDFELEKGYDEAECGVVGERGKKMSGLERVLRLFGFAGGKEKQRDREGWERVRLLGDGEGM